ncbi:hypothetical protein O988_00318 [Pseudogymnoascus sp. VKM F-3808]|nr:hypothetical protein O988_00318 [Pseudogymnoascus sp. VKM F-3808]
MILALSYFLGIMAMSVSKASSSIAPITTHTVAVGAAGLVYTPNTILANVKDVVEFRFYPQNHSVARAEYRHPCIPYEYTGVNKVGFWSGFQPVNVILQDVRLPKLMVLVRTNSLQPPQFSIVVNDTEPIFFYCSSPGACAREGMVGVINPNSNQTLEVQLAYAENSTLMFSPGEGYPSETTTPATSPSISSAPSYSPIALSSGAIAGIVIGVIAMVVVIGVLCLKWRRKKIGRRYLQNTPGARPAVSSEPVYPPQSPNIYSESSHYNQNEIQSSVGSPGSLGSPGSPYPYQFLPGGDQYPPVPQNGQQLGALNALNGPTAELSAVHSHSRPLSFEGPLPEVDSIAGKLGSM